MTEAEVIEISNLLRNQTVGLRFEKDVKFVKSKSPWALGVAAATVTAIAISFSLGGNSVSPAWSAEPNHASATDRTSSVTSCTNANGEGDTIALTQTSGFNPVDSHGNSIINDLGGAVSPDGSTTVTLASVPVVKAFDSRGKWNVTILDGLTSKQETATIVCVTGSPKTGSPLGGVLVQAHPVGSTPTDNFNVTQGGDGTPVIVGYGSLVVGATQVVLSAKGLPEAHASVENGSYAIWWPDGGGSAVVKQLDSAGKTLKAINVSEKGSPSVLTTGGSISINK